jgi:hypothetical protein
MNLQTVHLHDSILILASLLVIVLFQGHRHFQLGKSVFKSHLWLLSVALFFSGKDLPQSTAIGSKPSLGVSVAPALTALFCPSVLSLSTTALVLDLLSTATFKVLLECSSAPSSFFSTFCVEAHKYRDRAPSHFNAVRLSIL